MIEVEIRLHVSTHVYNNIEPPVYEFTFRGKKTKTLSDIFRFIAEEPLIIFDIKNYVDLTEIISYSCSRLPDFYHALTDTPIYLKETFLLDQKDV